MRVKTAKYNPGNIGSQEGPMDITFSGPLFLHADPVQEKHAVTKQYVDARFGNLDAGDLKTDVLPTSILPAFDGDVNSSQGSNVFTLSNTGVTPGTYTKVTVDLKGRVVGGGSLANEDIPNLSWSKMVRDKPTTLTGYGITDAVPMSGGTVGSAVKLNGLPSDELHVSNRQYLDNKVEALGSTASPGTVFRFSSDKTPEGFLRCSGGELDKVNYPALYSAIGDKFAPKYVGFGKPWKNQYDINVGDGTLGAWTTAPSLPVVSSTGQVVVTKNRVYLIGGQSTSSDSISTVCTAIINPDGTLGTWTTSAPIPEPLSGFQAIVTKNRVYLLGGGYGETNSISTVYTAIINSDGTLGTWTIDIPLPGQVSGSQAIILKDRVYILGGRTSYAYIATVYTAIINSDGTLGTWTTAPSLPEPLGWSESIVTKNRVYLIGGLNQSANYDSITFTAPINEDGTLGSWVRGPNFPRIIGITQAIVTKNKAYILSGRSGYGTVFTELYTAPVNLDGTLGTWVTNSNLPIGWGGSQAFMTSSRVYLIGGTGYNYYHNYVVTAPLTGGKNDYSQYYDGSHYVVSSPTKFKLPDHTHLEDQNTYYYIRY